MIYIVSKKIFLFKNVAFSQFLTLEIADSEKLRPKSRVFLWCSLSVLVIMILNGLGTTFQLLAPNGSLIIAIMKELDLSTTLAVFCATLAIAIVGAKIRIKLTKLQRFREEIQGQPSDEYEFLALTVFLLILFQILKLILHIARISLSAIIAYKVNKCEGIMNVQSAMKCSGDIYDRSRRAMYLNENWPYFFEYFIIIFLIIRKKSTSGK